MAKKKQGLSVRTVTLLAMIVVAYIGWGVAAAGYARHAEGWRAAGELLDTMQTQSMRGRRTRGIAAIVTAFVDFVVNSVKQIPSVFSVIGYTFRERIWLPVVVVVVEGVIAFGGYKMHSFEQTLQKTKRRAM